MYALKSECYVSRTGMQDTGEKLMMSAAKGNLTIFRATDYIQEKYYNLKS
jgi:uncharacterized metal-binding protein